MKGKAVLLGMALILGMGLEKSFATPPAFLLTIDVSNPSAVTITATGLNSGANDSGIEARVGVDLLNFFRQDETALLDESPPNSTLSGGNLTLSYNELGSDNYSTSGGNYLDLGLYVNGASPGANDPQTFSTTQPAFSGSWTIDFSSLGVDASALPTVGSQGDIMPGFSGDNHGTIIGQWQVEAVPEPGVGSFVLLGAGAGFAFWRRRARKNLAVRA